MLNGGPLARERERERKALLWNLKKERGRKSKTLADTCARSHTHSSHHHTGGRERKSGRGRKRERGQRENGKKKTKEGLTNEKKEPKASLAKQGRCTTQKEA